MTHDEFRHLRFQDEAEPPQKKVACKNCRMLEFADEIDVDGVCLECADQKLRAECNAILEM